MVQFYEFGDWAANRAVKKLKRFSLPAGKEPNMRYQTVIPGRFLSRPNRFVAQVETEEGGAAGPRGPCVSGAERQSEPEDRL